MTDHLSALKPTFATAVTAASTLGNVAVWQDVVKSWSALAVAIVAVPTAVCMLAYWALKVRAMWRDRNL